MKRISIIFITFITFLSCKAQIIPLIEDEGNRISGAYYKDVDNDLNKFEGTWKWEQDGKMLTLIFEKKEQLSSSISDSSFDLLIGEYKYEVDSQVIVNYLPRLQDNTIIGHNYYISGNMLLLKNDRPKCNQCNSFERRVFLFFHDPERPYLSPTLLLRHQLVNGVEQLQAKLSISDIYIRPTENSPTQPRVPLGEYILIKQ